MSTKGAEDTVQIGVDANSKANTYWLAQSGNQTLFSSGSRAAAGLPSDDFVETWDDFSGLGTGFYTGDDLMTAVKGKLYPRPTVTTLTDATGSLTFVHSWIEKGNYLYAIGLTIIYKFDISGAAPALMRVIRVADAYGSFNANDHIGQPAQMYSARATAGFRWYLPCNNGARMLALDTVSTEASQAFSNNPTLNGTINASTTTVVYTCATDPIVVGDIIIIDSERMLVVGVNGGTNTLTVQRGSVAGIGGVAAAGHTTGAAITQATPDTFTAVTAVTTGAAHFQQLPSGKIWRNVASLSAGAAVTPLAATLSSILPGSDCEVLANWSGVFYVDDQTQPIISLMNYAEQLIVGKWNGYFAGFENSDGTITWQSILPDANVSPTSLTYTAVGTENWKRGIVWHGRMRLPTNSSPWHSTISSAAPEGPDTIDANTGDEVSAASSVLRYGNVPQMAGIGAWLFSPYVRFGYMTEILAGREGANGIDFDLLFRASGGGGSRGCSPYIQKTGYRPGNGFGYSAWFAGGTDTTKFDIIALAPDGSPYGQDSIAAMTYGNASNTARLFLMPKEYPCRVMLREWRYVIENGDTNVAWGIEYALDGGSALTTVSTTVTASGSLYFTSGTNDQAAYRWQPIIKAVFGAGYTPTATPPRVVLAQAFGHYLPETMDGLVFTIDLLKTADNRQSTVEAIIAELEALRPLGAQAYVDRFGNAGFVNVTQTQFGQPQTPQGLVGEAFMQIGAVLLKTS